MVLRDSESNEEQGYLSDDKEGLVPEEVVLVRINKTG
eukprot:CAMPEP_0170490160 /NCGR_PEP_ID=MMETSP0208-20121228/8421_1 /TAXON_ID=197538 /ORGANISM="Strombidium inclinatum, Strain S3" /LENGTH=36 /DNA_ID= /DNA_START= /DNA_END= /DNA_ORIENTATION=